MEETRRGQIALLCVKRYIRQNGFPLTPADFNRKIERLAKELGIKYEETREFVESVIFDLLKEMFTEPKCGLVCTIPAE